MKLIAVICCLVIAIRGSVAQDVLVNLALNQPATQSSTSWSGLASYGVDGNKDPTYFHYSCTHTSEETDTHWWQVELSAMSVVYQVKIQNRDDEAHRLADLDISVGTSLDDFQLCAYFEGPGSLAVEEILDCTQPMMGKYVKIQKRNPGSTLSMCEVEVMGLAIDGSINLALNQPATQSSTSWSGLASYGVDGNKDPTYFHYSCTHTSEETDTHWWQVELMSMAVVYQVKIQNRNDEPYRLADLDISVGTTLDDFELCAYFQGPGDYAVEEILDCTQPMVGKYVKIQKRNPGSTLSMCEVEVMGYPIDDTGLANLALNQPATQSSTSWSGLASYGVDGNKDPTYFHYSCTHTSEETDTHWWQVELGSMSVVYQVRIQNRDDEGHRLVDLDISVGKTVDDFALCAYFEGPGVIGVEYAFSCAQPMIGKFVKIQKRNPGSTLSMCEVEVIGVAIE